MSMFCIILWCWQHYLGGGLCLYCTSPENSHLSCWSLKLSVNIFIGKVTTQWIVLYLEKRKFLVQLTPKNGISRPKYCQSSLKYKVVKHPQEENTVQWIWQATICWCNNTSRLVVTSILVSLQFKQEMTNLHCNPASWKGVKSLWKGLREYYFQCKCTSDIF